MRKLVLAALAAVLLVACGGDPAPVAEQAPASPATTVAPTTTSRPDPGVAVCKAVARRVKAGVAPTDVQRAGGWRQLQASQHAELRAAGAKLQRAWTAGDLADQVEANTNAAMACALYGVETKIG